ncbi:TIGR00159 family protein [Bacteroidia bacterium]|nr:TIGR00159 family protein [Bacteroidia bacterium]
MFFEIRILDIIDIVLVATLLYQLYKLIKGTVAINIFIGVLSIYGLWFIVKAFKMDLLSTILGQILSVGVLALIIVFQQEVRRFLLYIGTQYTHYRFSVKNIWHKQKTPIRVNIDAIAKAARNMSANKTGALMVIRRKATLNHYTANSDAIGAVTSNRLLENIFFKHSPLHDGAVIIENEIIVAARCVLPSTDQLDLPAHYGMRHRAAIGISEASDAVVVVVSEETGDISFVEGGKIVSNISEQELRTYLEKALNNT